MEKRLGKIRDVKFGFGGYRDACIGLSMTLDSSGTCVNIFVSGGWNSPPSDGTSWTLMDQAKQQSEMVLKLTELMKQAKIEDITKLEGKPVEITFDGMILKDWRLLTEVL